MTSHGHGVIPVLMAGGSGTRLWPVSREILPKQLVALAGDDTLLQRTARRFLKVAPAGDVVCVGAEPQAFLVRQQLEAVDPDLAGRMILEPAGRNTAAAVALAALHARAEGREDAVLWVCPADHLISDVDALLDAVRAALPAARAGELATFGIRPDRADPGLGYIRLGAAGGGGVHRVERFVEKPDADRAEAMLAEGGWLWNSGIFLFRADRILEELRTHAPDLLAAVEAAFAAGARDAEGNFRLPREAFAAVPARPIDKAVMERSERVVVVPCDPGWSDLGSWQALWERLPRDERGNAVTGDGLVVGASGCLIRAEDRLVVLAGVRDLAVIDTADALLVAPRDDADAVRAAVSALKAADRPEARSPAAERRPWGRFRVLHEAEGFKVKEIVVEPGAQLSLQSHRRRAEHWTVVMGLARVTVDDAVHDLEPGGSVDVPLGAVHRMANPGAVPMHLIEVQRGDYLGEDDIIRYEDVYGRS